MLSSLLICLLGLVSLSLSNSISTDQPKIVPLANKAVPCMLGELQDGITLPDNNCEVDGYVGSYVIYEDDSVRVWNFTLPPGAMTSMHSHDFDYHFVAIQPSQLEVYGESGEVLFDFRAEGVLGFKLDKEKNLLLPSVELPFPVPRVHAAKNIGPTTYYEILYENKATTVDEITNQEL